MKEVSINLDRYPWYDKHARAIRTVARYAGIDVDRVLKTLDPAMTAHNASLPDAALQRKAA